MNESILPALAVRKLAEVMRNGGRGEIPVRFVKDERDASRPGALGELT